MLLPVKYTFPQISLIFPTLNFVYFIFEIFLRHIASTYGDVPPKKQTYYRWRKEYGGLNITQAKKLKELEKENAHLKNLVADLSLDNAILP